MSKPATFSYTELRPTYTARYEVRDGRETGLIFPDQFLHPETRRRLRATKRTTVAIVEASIDDRIDGHAG